MYPSVKTIKTRLNLSADDAAQVRGLIDGSLNPYDFESVQNAERQCFNRLGDIESTFIALNEVLNGCGSEAIFASGYVPSVEYLNFGDTYATTVLYDYDRDLWFIESWGDWVEKAERRGLRLD